MGEGGNATEPNGQKIDGVIVKGEVGEMKVALYARVSTTEQAEKGTSIGTQIEALETESQRNKFQIYDKYIDGGYSGATLERPALQKLIEDAKHKRFDKVLVYKTDRLARSLLHTVDLVLGIFEKLGIGFRAITEPFETSTLTGKALFGQLAVFADYERGMIRERTREGKLRKIREGKWIGANPHYAYDKDENKKLVVNPGRYKVYRMMVEWILQGENCNSVARKLNDLGIPTWKKEHGWKTKKANHLWHFNVVRTILLNPVTKGEAVFRGIPIKVPAVISKEEFKNLEDRLKVNKKKAKRNTKRFYLLRGLLFCKRCGSVLHGIQQPYKKYPDALEKAYFCPSGQYSRGDKSCGLRRIKLPFIESYVWETTKELVMDSRKLKEAIKAREIELLVNGVISQGQLKEYESQIKALKEEKGRILSLYGKSEIFTIEELEAEAMEVVAKIRELSEKRDKYLDLEARISAQNKHIEQAESYFKSISKRLDNFTDEEKKELVHMLFSRIVVDWDKKNRKHILELEGSIPVFETETSKPQEKHHIVTMQSGWG